MPESEPKPKLIELVAPGAGQGWKAVLRNGKPAVVHEIPIPAAEGAAAAPRLQRLYEHRHPALSPVLAWGTDPNGVWVAVEPNEGTPLGSILTRGPLTPPAAAALGAAVLSGVAALHEAGIAMGGFGAAAVRVTTNGEVRLAGHPAAAVRGAPSQSDLRADVRSAGMAVCAAFGVDPAGAPAPPNIPPGLVVTMRSMASGAMGPSADRAQGALREMAAALLSPDREMAAQSELATRSGGREVPPITPFLPAGTVAPQQRQSVAPAPYVAPSSRDETPARKPVSYDAPERSVQTYPSMPAVTFPPVPTAPAAASSAPLAPPPPIPSAPSVPTWSDPPARQSIPFETTSPPDVTNPPAPAAPAPPVPEPQPEPPRPTFPSFESVPPPAPAMATNPPSPAAPAPSATTWSTVGAPVWKPGEVVPPGMGSSSAPEPFAAPGSAATQTAPPPSTPVRKPYVPRPASSRGVLSERPPWLVPAAVAVAIVLLLGIVGVIVLAGRGHNPVGQVHTTPSAHPSSSAKASPTPSTGTIHEVPTLAPATAGQVKAVQFCTTSTPCPFTNDKDTACTFGGSCAVDVGVIFTSAYTGTYSYDIMYFDRCTGDAPTTLLSHPDKSTGFTIGEPPALLNLQLPTGAKSVALFVVTRTPAVAQSAPLLLGSDTC
ncbi:MAG TPA: hypothetical protein VN906_06050 [Candidatus Sulfotelmatobacter sp.]|nr:hypothetical protein [Candidatus Sulfotelmatobacter sp.]